MNSEELNYQLLASYMAGECTSEEEKIIAEWAQDSQNRKKLEKFKRIWNAAEHKKKGAGEVNLSREWNRLQGRISTRDGKVATKMNRKGKSFRSSSIHSFGHFAMRIAAIFLVTGLIGVFVYQNWEEPKPEQAKETVLRTISTDNAQRANFTLGDGSSVHLNAGSTVEVPDKFESDRREVYLEGEAYFDVESNPDKPFVIHSRESTIEVLGTSFSIRSYDEDGHVRVVVEEGTVSLKAKDENQNEEATLSANELGLYNLENSSIEKSEIKDMQLYMSWRDGYLKFQDEPMKNVAKDFERRYGVEVLFDDPDLQELSLTAYLKSRSLKNVLDVIAKSLDITYELNDDEVTFMN